MSPERFKRNSREFDGTKGDTYPEHVDFKTINEEPEIRDNQESSVQECLEELPTNSYTYFSGADLHDFARKTGERSASAADDRIRREVASFATNAAFAA